MTAMLLLKLTLVPTLLGLVTIAARRWGPGAGGALAGMPWMVAPILLVLLIERGPEFAANASAAAFLSVLASCSYLVSKAIASRHLLLVPSMLVAAAAWLVVAAALVWWSPPLWVSVLVNLAAVGGLPLMLPRVSRTISKQPAPRHDLVARMVAGAALTLIVSALADRLGVQWSGVIAAFPVISVVLGAMTRIGYGTDYMTATFRGMAQGYYSLAVFSLVLALALPRFGSIGGFLLACVASAVVQWAVLRFARR